MGAITSAGFIWEWRQDYVSLILPWLVSHLHVRFHEEIVFRGYLLGILARKKGYLVAIALSSITLSLVHWLNYPFNLLFYLNLALAGVLLSLIRLHFDSLWPAIGFHLGWNWMQYHVFGYGVSTLIRFSHLQGAPVCFSKGDAGR